MYRAMYHVHRLRDENTSRSKIALVATVHDEMILAYTDGYEALAKQILEEGMILGWLDIFPDTDTHNLVEAGAGPTWGSAKK